MRYCRAFGLLVALALAGGPSLAWGGVPTFPGTGSGGGAVNQVHAGTNVTVTGTTADPIVNATGGGGAVSSVTAGSGCVTVSPTTGAVIVTSTGCLANSGGAVALSNIAAIADQRILGNVSGGSASPIALTAAQINTFLGTVPSPAATGLTYFTTGSPGTLTAITTLTGLTATSTSLADNLATGVSGGQTATGGTASGDALTLVSTSNATKGKINMGATPVAYFDETKTITSHSTPMFVVGTPMTGGGALISSIGNTNEQLYVYSGNTNNGTITEAGFLASTTSTGGAPLLSITETALSGYTTTGVITNQTGRIYQQGSGPLVIQTLSTVAGASIIFAQTSSSVERMRIAPLGNITFGVGLATGATDGFPYENGMAGNPTGVPTTFNSGHSIAETYDYTNDRLNFYNNANGAWRGVPLATAATAGSQTLLQTNGPAGITSTTPKWEQFKDAAGVTSYREYWQ